jgi:hypothetical protein
LNAEESLKALMLSLNVLCVAAVLAAAGVAGVTINGPLRATTVGPATYYWVGHGVGAAFKDMIHARYATIVASGLLAFVEQHAEARALNATMWAAAHARFPQVMEELQGVADGSALPFAAVFLLNSNDDLEMMQQKIAARGPRARARALAPLAHCTDVRSETATESLWGHNEDSGRHDVNHTYLVTATVVDIAGRTIEQFTVYSYAGSVGGKAFGWNSHGLVVSTNALFAKDQNWGAAAVPRAVLTRALFGERSASAALDVLRRARPVDSFALNLGQLQKSGRFADVMNVEVDPAGALGVTMLDPALPGLNHYYHANDFVRLVASQYLDNSSIFRMQRLLEMPVPVNVSGVTAMLGDRANLAWPVYRTGSNGQDAFTMVTVVFDPAAAVAHLYLTNPKDAAQPAYSVPMWTAAAAPAVGPHGQPPTAAPGDDHHSHVVAAAAIGAVCGVVATAAIIGAALFLRQRRRATPTVLDERAGLNSSAQYNTGVV